MTYNACYSGPPPNLGDSITFIIEKKVRTYNPWCSVCPYVKDVKTVSIVEEEGTFSPCYSVFTTRERPYNQHYRRRGGTWNTCYSVRTHVRDAKTLIIVGKEETYNPWCSVPHICEGRYNCHYSGRRGGPLILGTVSSAHVQDVITLIIGEGRTYILLIVPVEM